jgi:hypothetical protein
MYSLLYGSSIWPTIYKRPQDPTVNIPTGCTNNYKAQALNDKHASLGMDWKELRFHSRII